ncbi:SCO1431 family membrane protein [Streptomyces beihaiensis]|uniref:SCO1431 family membrane protein n=1 Tax=Streptomyces beihaiensis TaxID=2984495 RepID=A0ABT3TNT9_9ACTN|nr:SCO1431 family membrane protein [Streptomyces beihaiensis]MCX3058717.1 SCO1431 family membrane protein [Streptomyces beihaiensis]
MTASSATASAAAAAATVTKFSSRARARARGGGPREDGPKIMEHVLGWTLVVVVAMLVTQIGLM